MATKKKKLPNFSIKGQVYLVHDHSITRTAAVCTTREVAQAWIKAKIKSDKYPAVPTDDDYYQRGWDWVIVEYNLLEEEK